MRCITDIWFASYLIEFKQIPLSKYKVLGKNKLGFYFELDDTQWSTLRLEYVSSDLSRLRQTQDRLKDLLY